MAVNKQPGRPKNRLSEPHGFRVLSACKSRTARFYMHGSKSCCFEKLLFCANLAAMQRHFRL